MPSIRKTGSKKFLSQTASDIIRSANSMAITVGQTLGTYQVLSLLGRGGMGEVYRARDTQLQRHIALELRIPCAIDFSHTPATKQGEHLIAAESLSDRDRHGSSTEL